MELFTRLEPHNLNEHVQKVAIVVEAIIPFDGIVEAILKRFVFKSILNIVFSD